MRNLKNVEVFHIETTNEGMFAHISFQDPNKLDDINDGYDHVRVKINPREIQNSVRNNPLVNQSLPEFESLPKEN